MIAFAMRSAARFRVLAAGVVLAGVLGAPPARPAQLCFSETAAAELRVAPLTVRAAVTPKEGPVAVRVQFSVTAPAGATVPDLYLLWPGEVKNDPSLGARDPALAHPGTPRSRARGAGDRAPLRCHRRGAPRPAGTAAERGGAQSGARAPEGRGPVRDVRADGGHAGAQRARDVDPHSRMAAAHGPRVDRHARDPQPLGGEGEALDLLRALGA